MILKRVVLGGSAMKNNESNNKETKLVGIIMIAVALVFGGFFNAIATGNSVFLIGIIAGYLLCIIGVYISVSNGKKFDSNGESVDEQREQEEY